jgi:hypothetical protein
MPQIDLHAQRILRLECRKTAGPAPPNFIVAGQNSLSPDTLEEGGTLRRLWTAHQPAAGSVPKYQRLLSTIRLLTIHHRTSASVCVSQGSASVSEGSQCESNRHGLQIAFILCIPSGQNHTRDFRPPTWKWRSNLPDFSLPMACWCWYQGARRLD